MKWKILETGPQSAEKNMAIDAQLLQDMHPNDPPLLHFYQWEGKPATYGYFLHPDKFFDWSKKTALGLSLARRPTGGGIIFHLSDFAFSVLIPAQFPHYSAHTLDNYQFINAIVKRAVQNVLKTAHLSLLAQEPTSIHIDCVDFCMAKPTQYDVMLGKWKIAGAAQRRKKQGYLHQGSICIALPNSDFLNQVLLKGREVYEAMCLYTYPLLGKDWAQGDLKEMRTLLKSQLQKEFTQ